MRHNFISQILKGKTSHIGLPTLDETIQGPTIAQTKCEPFSKSFWYLCNTVCTHDLGFTCIFQLSTWRCLSWEYYAARVYNSECVYSLLVTNIKVKLFHTCMPDYNNYMQETNWKLSTNSFFQLTQTFAIGTDKYNTSRAKQVTGNVEPQRSHRGKTWNKTKIWTVLVSATFEYIKE